MTANPQTAERRRWIGLLARAAEADLEQWHARANAPEFTWLRPPETGLVMVRARAGGTGGQFNLGEMTVTRCTLRIAGGTAGVAYVAGRSHRHAQIAALADALLQVPRSRPGVEAELLAPLAAKETEATAQRSRRAAATRVEFFTLVRGED
jgi:alpha-D-ribose 1-methylphosphonate 5-triphosphate synthase subunit PhnG